MAETADEAVEPIKQKTCVLKASIHCEGCKRKVKKILSQVQGVDFVDVDTKQQKVTVYGSVDPDTLIKKLAKSGKHAELWPQQKPEKRDKFSGDGKNKETETQTHTKIDPQEANPTTLDKQPEPSTKVQQAAKRESNGGAEESGGGTTAAKGVSDSSVKKGVEETKPEEEKKSEEGSSPSGQPPQAAEKKETAEKSNGGGGGGGGGDGGTSGKKKKKKGQSGNLTPSAPSSAGAQPAHRVLENQEPGPPHPTNHSPPRNHHYPPPHHYYTPPPPPQPVYGVNYNAAYPSSSYTASYYAAPPPYSYAYMHPGPQAQPPPSDPEFYPRQPLDSFEMFSDENPNGCFIM